jgi:hypothetical protein
MPPPGLTRLGEVIGTEGRAGGQVLLSAPFAASSAYSPLVLGFGYP